MIEIVPRESTQYINFETLQLVTTSEYLIRRTATDVETFDILNVDPDSLPPIPIDEIHEPGDGTELLIKYRLFERRLASSTSLPIETPPAGTRELPCSCLPLDLVQASLTDKQDAEFLFTLERIERLAREEIVRADRIDIVESPGEGLDETIITIRNNIQSQSGAIPVKNLFLTIGDLHDGIIWEPTIFGLGDSLWRIRVDNLLHEFTREEYREHINRALKRTEPPLARVEAHFRQDFRLDSTVRLTVDVLIDSVPGDRGIRVQVKRRAPERELFYPTGNQSLDEVILRVQSQLIDRGLPIRPEDPRWQALLKYFLLYRNLLLTAPPQDAFADPAHLRQSERNFHNHLFEKLHFNLEFGTIDYEVTTGNSRIDLLIGGIPNELKVERQTELTTSEIIDAYKEQTADYTARKESPLGFLVVLDGVPRRDSPVPPASHDVKVVAVKTASGEDVTIVGIVIRLPRRASDFS